MEGKLRCQEKELFKLKRAVNVNNLEITFISYTRLQPNTPIGYSESEVNFIYSNADDVFKMGLFFGKEKDDYTFGTITIDFP
jgi:hypothetical protein